MAIAEESTRKKKKKVVLTPDEALDRLLAKHDRKKARQAARAAGRSAPYAAPDVRSELPRPPPIALPDRQPEPAPTIQRIDRRGEKRKSQNQLQKRTKPSQPVVVERFDISDQTDHLPPGAGDQEPPPVTFNLGTAKTLAKHMASNRSRKPAPRAEPSTALAVRASKEETTGAKLTKTVKKAVKAGSKTRKELKKPRKVERSTTEPQVTYV